MSRLKSRHVSPDTQSMTTRYGWWVVAVCALVVAGCGDDLAPRDDLADMPDDLAPDALVAADAGLVVELAADAAVVVAPDASQAPVDGSVELTAAPDASTPVAPPCTVALHRDADADGFGAAATSVVACGAAGYVTDATDCYDGNAQARPRSDLVGGFGEDRGDGSFDFDCDGVETPAKTNIAHCPVFTPDDVHCTPNNLKYPYQAGDKPASCYDEIRARVDAVSDGWWGQVPACGQIGPYGVALTYSRETSYVCSGPANGGPRQTCH